MLNKAERGTMKNLKLKDKIALVLILAMAISNPATGQYVLQGLDWLFTQIFVYGAIVSLITAIYLLGWGAWYYHKTEQPNIPKKIKIPVIAK